MSFTEAEISACESLISKIKKDSSLLEDPRLAFLKRFVNKEEDPEKASNADGDKTASGDSVDEKALAIPQVDDEDITEVGWQAE